MNHRLTAILSHLPAPDSARIAAAWQASCPDSDILLVYGGSQDQFNALESSPKVFVPDPRLRTRDHQRERQSYQGVFSAISTFLAPFPQYKFIHFTEFDCVPLHHNLPLWLENRLAAENADVLGCRLSRIDGTNHPHFLYHAADPAFRSLIHQTSSRPDPSVVLSMLGCMSFWKRNAFDAVANFPDASPFYLELIIPTLAHHLGFRVRNLPDQSPFVKPSGTFKNLPLLLQSGAVMAHPVKTFPTPTP